MMLSPMRINVSILLTVLLSMMAGAIQTSTFAMPGIGTVNGLAVEVVKVTTNPTGAMDAIDRTGPVGGNSVSVYVKVQYGNAITSINSVTVSIHEFGVSTSAGSLTLSSYTPLADSGSGDATVHTRVYTGTWNTLTTTPMIYNANYCFKATVDYDRDSTHATPVVDSDEVSVPVKNLIIKTVSPAEYVVLQAGQTGSVTFTVTLDDFTTTATYNLVLTLRHTATNTTVADTVNLTNSTGLTHTLNWPLTANGQPKFPYGGYYTFELTASKQTGGVTDTQLYRSTRLTMVSDDVLFSTDDQGNLLHDQDGKAIVLAKYKLSEQPQASSVNIHYYSDATHLDDYPTALSDQNRYDPPNLPVEMSLALGTNMSVRPIFLARDTGGDSYRDKQPRPMLCVNAHRTRYIRYPALSFCLNNHRNPAGTPYDGSYLRELGATLDTMAYGPLNYTTAWHAINNWEANTSYRPTYMNSDNDNHEFATNGPIPESNGRNQLVAENATSECYHVDDDHIVWDTTTNSNADYVWMDANGTPQLYDGTYRQHRLTILNDSNTSSFSNPNVGVTREYLAIHADDGSDGTYGCIGLWHDTQHSLWNRVVGKFTSSGTTVNNGAIFVLQTNNQNPGWIPLMVWNATDWTVADMIGTNASRSSCWDTANP